MLPVIAIVGRPNVGKSTLFNRLTHSMDALVVDLPGTTRDRKYGKGKVGKHPYILIDTGGVGAEEDGIDHLMSDQSWLAINEADLILFMVDCQTGLIPGDQQVAKELRQIDKPIVLVVNKIDGVDHRVAAAEFYSLGLDEPFLIAAKNNRSVSKLADYFLDKLGCSEEVATEVEADDRIKVAIVGRPNVGKSTLVNRLLGEDRVVVYDRPGTTRDSLYITLDRNNKKYTIIDTAGVRRKSKVKETVEKFSVVKALQAIEDCNVVILVVDATDNITDKDLSLIEFIIEAGKGLIVAINKWDGLSSDQKRDVQTSLGYKLNFASFAICHCISALYGSGVGDLFDFVNKIYSSATKERSTAELTKVLQRLIVKHTPPLVQGRRIKLKYAHAGGYNPPQIIIHGNQTEHVPATYKRYLMNAFGKALKLIGTPVRLEFRTGDNPYKDKRNVLTDRQQQKRARLKKFADKGKGKRS